MNKFKAILTDFDGTLVNFDCEIGVGVDNLIQKIKNKGIHFSISTGRPYYKIMQDFILEHQLSDVHIFHGGGLILNTANNKILWKSQPIDFSSLKIIVDYLKKTQFLFALETLNRAYMSKLLEMPIYGDESREKTLADFHYNQDVYKIMIAGRYNEITEEKVDELIKIFKKQSNTVNVFKYKSKKYFGLDITSLQSSKLSTLIQYAKIFHISPKQIIAIGNGDNDFPLFLASGYKIAMSNSPKELKEIADLVVPNESNQGMKEALTKLLEMNLF